jgi:hypothetical protein
MSTGYDFGNSSSTHLRLGPECGCRSPQPSPIPASNENDVWRAISRVQTVDLIEQLLAIKSVRKLLADFDFDLRIRAEGNDHRH